MNFISFCRLFSNEWDGGRIENFERAKGAVDIEKLFCLSVISEVEKIYQLLEDLQALRRKFHSHRDQVENLKKFWRD